MVTWISGLLNLPSSVAPWSSTAGQKVPWDVPHNITKFCFVLPMFVAEGSEAFCEQ